MGKIERELRPTVIVTDSDTVLLGHPEAESRRIKRVPKKFQDYTGSKNVSMSDNEYDEPANKKQKVKPSSYSHDLAYHQKLKDGEANHSFEEWKSIRNEVRKMLHASVDVKRLEHLDKLEPWCMVHKLYKCQCKGALMTGQAFELVPPTEENKRVEPVKRSVPIKIIEKPKIVIPSTPEPPSPAELENNLIDDGFSRRVLPIAMGTIREKPKSCVRKIFNSDDGLPKIEIVNLSELINDGIGPIFINIYDDKTTRLNPILRSLLNNKSAIIYFEGYGYFVDKCRVNIANLDFSQMESELDHPIFILQGKDDFPSPSSTSADEFVKYLFKKDSGSFIQITDKARLKEIAEIIESILRNVKKKIEAKIGNEPSELVKEQLSMIRRDRSRSISTSASNSSTHSSPLHFQGLQLTEAPPPGLNTPLMKEFNQIFSMRMQRLVGLVASNTLGLRPSSEMLNKFYLYQWSLLLKSYEEDLVQIWQVTLESEDDKKYQMMVLTDSREVPEIEYAKKENIVNIRKLSISDNLSELTRLILLRIEKASMKNMTILFYGCNGYLRICGIVNSKENYQNGFIAKPSRVTHPRIAAKLQKIYHIWYASKMAREKRRMEELDKQNAVSEIEDWEKDVRKKQHEVRQLNGESKATDIEKGPDVSLNQASQSITGATSLSGMAKKVKSRNFR